MKIVIEVRAVEDGDEHNYSAKGTLYTRAVVIGHDRGYTVADLWDSADGIDVNALIAEALDEYGVQV